MSTRIKIAIAAAIVAALVGLIILDQRPTGTVAQQPAEAPAGGVTVHNDLPAPIGEQVRQAGREIERSVQQAVNATPPAPPATPQAPAPAAPPPTAETYEVQGGDSLYTIAERAYGDGNKWKLIADANPRVNAHTLRVGFKLTIPPKPGAQQAAAPAQPATEGSVRTYVIQAGDSLEKLAARFYRNGRWAAKLYEANRDTIASADCLAVGTKIVLPEFAAEAQAPVVTPGDAAPAAAAGRRTYRVKSGDSLWKIAKTVAPGKPITETMEKIRTANTDKLESTGTPLQVDWVIVIPE